MINSTKVSVTLLDKKDMSSYSDCVRKTIKQTLCCSKFARDSEENKYEVGKLKRMFDDPNILLVCAKVDSKIVGFNLIELNGGMMYLLWGGVDTKHRKMGLRTKMHEFTFALAKKHIPKIHKIWCDIRINNIPANNLIKKMGFKKIATIYKHWYKQDYYLWEKILE